MKQFDFFCKKVPVGNDQEKAQSQRESLSKTPYGNDPEIAPAYLIITSSQRLVISLY